MSIIGCPNKSKLQPLTFTTYIKSHNIKYLQQHLPILSQNEPYTYLGIKLVPSLKWSPQQHVISEKRKSIAHTTFILHGFTTPKTQNINIVIELGIEYIFYAVSFSTTDILKLDQLPIKLTNIICNIPISAPNIFATLPKDTLGMGTFSLFPRYATILA